MVGQSDRLPITIPTKGAFVGALIGLSGRKARFYKVPPHFRNGVVIRS
jgi:hypothetical protein